VTKLSDHLPCLLAFDIKEKTKTYPKFIEIQSMTEKQTDNFCEKVHVKMAENTDHIVQETDVNKAYDALEEIITTQHSTSFPKKKVRFNKYIHKIHPWIDSGIMRSIKKRDSMYKKLKKTHHTNPTYLTKKINLDTYNSILKASIRQMKSDYYRTEFAKYSDNIKKTWDTISTILNRNKKNKENFPSHFLLQTSKEVTNTDGTVTKSIVEEKVTNKTQIANHFNDYFSNIGNKLASEIKYTGNKTVSTYLKDNILSKFNLKEITETQLEEIINSLNTKHSSGYDKISTYILKKISKSIITALVSIINKSITTGIFPDKLKLAIVSPIYKGQNLNIHFFNSYRPISLLPSISKIFEKVVYIQLYAYMTDNNLLHISQYGFRKAHSTELAALELVDRVGKELDSKKTPISIFLDLSKAFDTLDHKILLTKLQYYGADTMAMKWFSSYLTNRKQALKYDDTYSDWNCIETGVPQGSVLGPLLFIIYINDIDNVSKLLNEILFADDTSLICTLSRFSTQAPKTPEEWELLSSKVNEELGKVNEWLMLNKLSLNIKKTKFIIFRHKTSKKDTKLSLKMNNIPIEQVRTFTFLGLKVNETLTWKDHIEDVANKISKTIGILSRLKKSLPIKILKMIYSALILPRLHYCNLAWGYNPGRIEVLQRKAVRIITSSKYNAHTDPIFKKLNTLKLKDIHICNKLKFFYKLENNLLPPFFWQYMFTANTTKTRSKDPYQQLVPKTKIFTDTIRFSLPILLQHTPPLIKEKTHTHSMAGFTTYIKKNMIDKYNDECRNRSCYICNRK